MYIAEQNDCNMKLNINKGDKFGNFIVVEELETVKLPSGQTNRIFNCSCVCGNEKKIRLSHLYRGKIKSCGCLNISKNLKTKQEKYIRKIWRAIKYRTAENYSESHLYYDKGVVMCEDWKNNFNSFLHWALNNGLDKNLHIDRINGDGNYEPNNCRVATPIVNGNNRSDTMYINYKGRNIAFMLLIREKRLFKNSNSIRSRIKRGWSVERAFDTPIKNGNYKRINKRV